MIPTTITATLLSALAYAVLAAAGAMLWRRTRARAVATMAIGFVMVLVAELIALVQNLEIKALVRSHPADTLFIVQHHALLQYVTLVGLWLASVGLLSHSGRASGG